jgi:hypothetical protein
MMIETNGPGTLHVTRYTLYIVQYITHHTSPHLTPHTSHLTPHTSHLTPHTSHLTPHTSHLTPHTSHLTPHSSPHTKPPTSDDLADPRTPDQDTTTSIDRPLARFNDLTWHRWLWEDDNKRPQPSLCRIPLRRSVSPSGSIEKSRQRVSHQR